MEKRRTYLISGLIFILLAFGIVLYPIATYFFGIYLGSNHDIHKPGAYFTYAGALLTEQYVYHFEVLENGSYNFTAILYKGLKLPGYGYSQDRSPPKDWRWPFFGSKPSTVTKVCEVHRVLPENDSLVQFLFPEKTVYVLNESREIVPLVGLDEDGGYVNWYFLPRYLGFPRLYAPKGLERFNRTLAIKLNSSEYFPVVRYLKGENGYYAIAVHPKLPEVLDRLGLRRFFNESCLTRDLDRYSSPGGFPQVMLVRTNVQPFSQDWGEAFKYSFTHYAAPVDYVLLLAGIILLILAGRANG